MWRVAAIVVLTASLLLAPHEVSACATCMVGDPTLTTMGTQQPVAQRVRASLEVQTRSDAVGQEGVDRVELTEQRLSLSVAYAPSSWLMVSITAPLVLRQITQANLSRDALVGVGDAEVRSKWFVLRDRDFAPQHLFSLVAGVKLPTGSVSSRNGTGTVAPELQAGSGSVDPILGLSYAFFGGDFSAFISEVVYIPLAPRGDFRTGTSLRGTHTVQYQFVEFLAARLSFNTRLETATRLYNPDRREPDSGGFIGYLAPALVISPLTDLVVYLEAQVPVVNALVGDHDEGLLAMLGLAYDF